MKSKSVITPLWKMLVWLPALLTGSLSGKIIQNAPPVPELKDGAWDTLKLTWTKPEVEASHNGIPIGNNYIAAKIKGGVETEILQLNDKTFHSGGPATGQDPKRKAAMEICRQKLTEGDIPAADAAAREMWGPQEVANYLPIGTMYLKFDHGDQAKNYLRTLDLDQALSTVKYDIGGVTYTREAFASFPDRVIVMRLSASQAGKLSFTASLSYPKEMEGHGTSVAVTGNNVIVMKGKAPMLSNKYEESKGMTFESLLWVKPTGGKIQSANGSLRVEGADSVLLIFADATSYNGPFKDPASEGLNPTPIVKDILTKAARKSYEQLFSAHVADHQSLFRRLWVEINGEKPNKYALGLQYARYDIIASSRSGDRPHNQQGMWNKDWKPHSNCAHFLNENVQKYYGIIETTNIAATGEPLWNWMDELAKNGAETAKIDWGFHGWLAPHYSDVWASTTVKGGNNEWAIWPMGGAWLCNNLWDHYAFSLDKSFLAKRAYPLMRGAAEFCLDYLVDDGKGHLVTSPSTSPENRFDLPDGKTYAVSQGSTIDLALTRELFQNCISASEVLNVDVDFRKKLQATLPKILPYQINGAGELQEWSQDFKKHYVGHRHASHIVSVWPLTQITERATPDLFKAAKTSLDERGRGGDHPDKGAMWARLKEGDKALAALGGNGHGMAAQWSVLYSGMPEMLLFSHNRDEKGNYELELLPALASSWKSGKVSGLRGRGGYEVEIEWAGGELKKCHIDSSLGTIPAIRYQGNLLDPAGDPRVTLNLQSAR
ncbi:MAG: glycoside hydrolase family 95 protein [Luteolibacter sp.]